ncbi:hypothetical protein NDI76_00975 [Halogeometricum sp. S1BR25-6]|uniref:Transmembrane protein n=1 Tax=Halogeometricum salsisoli TaxID=2950536 RepID=A0ABU2G965_9EURY|nr:hypothetical protein [Halogeometricum sp. S1BR25-6]MDS0297314.1 hypothetical protein [Halogeometricum sp. S1BR25-6]
MSDGSGDRPGDGSSLGNTAFWGVWEFLRFVGLWVAFATVLNPLPVVVHTALVTESLSQARTAAQVFALVAASITYGRYPRTSAIKLWGVGLASSVLFGVVASAVGASNPPVSGSPFVALRLFLLWAGSLALSAGLLWNWWRGEDAERKGDERPTA